MLQAPEPNRESNNKTNDGDFEIQFSSKKFNLKNWISALNRVRTVELSLANWLRFKRCRAVRFSKRRLIRNSNTKMIKSTFCLFYSLENLAIKNRFKIFAAARVSIRESRRRRASITMASFSTDGAFAGEPFRMAISIKPISQSVHLARLDRHCLTICIT